jgi:hypothetical protein
MATAIDVSDPIALRKAGMRALTTALGSDVARAFVNQTFGGSGDWTRERHELPDISLEQLTAELDAFDEDAFLEKYGGD